MARVSTKKLYSKCILLGTGATKIVLDNSQVFSLIHLAMKDIGWTLQGFPELDIFPSLNYFDIELEWFTSITNPPESQELQDFFETLIDSNPDFGLYFLNLCSLHKRRVKYQNILSNQPRPTMEQIGPRGLLEFGLTNNNLLADWMIWRKWIFDIDNRAGQETGYLFEPILASCLGGEPMSSSKSPVKRINAAGNPTSGGRQVDCFVASDNIAYEFKLRVTIAASGQGRFAEELSFPKECRAAGIKPILLVLDSTPSNRLTELGTAFTDNGGEVHIGDNAWNYLNEHSGEIISTFIEKYIKVPLIQIAESENHSLSEINLSWTDEAITISNEEESYNIERE